MCWGPTLRTNHIHPPYQEQIVWILDHSFWMRKEGYRKSTIESAIASLKALAKDSDIKNPEWIKEHLSKRPVSESTKEKLVFLYLMI